MPAFRWLRPEIIYLLLGLSMQMALVFVTPPFQVPDEPAHFYRAFQVSEGRFLGSRGPAGKGAGGTIPTSLERTVDTLVRDVRHHADRRYSTAWLDQARAMPLDSRKRSFTYFATGSYSPIPYLPQAVGIATGRLFDCSPVALLYLGRIMSALFAVSVGYLTLRAIPCFKWALLLLLMMPMTMFQASSLSADVVTNDLCFALFGSILSRLGSTAAIPRVTQIGWIALLTLIALTKGIYLFVGALILLIPRERFDGWLGHRRFLLASFGTAGLALLIWNGLVLSQGLASANPDPAVDAHQQLQFVRAHPLGFLGTVARSYIEHATPYRHMFIGVLGWLDTHLPWWFVEGYACLLLVVGLSDGGPSLRLSARSRLILGLAVLVVMIGLTFIFYLAWTEVGGPRVEGIQGRYFIPIAPLVLLVTSSEKASAWVSPWVRPAVCLPAIALSVAVTLWALAERYYI